MSWYSTRTLGIHFCNIHVRTSTWKRRPTAISTVWQTRFSDRVENKYSPNNVWQGSLFFSAVETTNNSITNSGIWLAISRLIWTLSETPWFTCHLRVSIGNTDYYRGYCRGFIFLKPSSKKRAKQGFNIGPLNGFVNKEPLLITCSSSSCLAVLFSDIFYYLVLVKNVINKSDSSSQSLEWWWIC